MTVASFAGRISDMEIGLSMVSLMDPLTRESATFSGVFYQYMFSLFLLITGMYLPLCYLIYKLKFDHNSCIYSIILFIIQCPSTINVTKIASTFGTKVMGMMMLPPTTISMPFKILLFVLADGWYWAP